jgi:hydrophobic/amphiphilic exporter-1 (mainly G- bacteria), HAE1 family
VGLTRVSIVRPLFIAMLTLAMVVIGGVSYTRLGVDLLPAIDFPVVSVAVPYPGAGPESVEQLVVKPIEDALAGEANLDYMVSQASEGFGAVTLVYKDRANADTAAINVERKVNGIRGALPQDIQPPSVVRAEISAMPVLNLSVAGSRPAGELYRLVDETIVPKLSTVPGVASVGISGGEAQEVVVKVDLDKLRAYGLSILQLNQALQAENLNVPAGTVTERGRDYAIRLNALYPAPERIRDTIVAATPTGAVRVRDVAEVAVAPKRVTRIQRTDGNDAIGLLVTKQADANTLEVADGVKAALDRLRAQLPADVRVTVVSDESVFTRATLDDVRTNLVEAVALTGLVLLVFLHTLRSTFIVLVSIPTSLIATFTMMYALGFTLNMMSMMALALTVGILVDDSIVVLENIFRHLEAGEDRFSAALAGRSEIGLAAIAITLVDVVVYLPIAFMSGIVGQYFRQFGLVVATATLLSLFVSFTLTPMLASKVLALPKPHSRTPLALFGRVWERGFSRLGRGYEQVLRWALRWRWATVIAGALSLAAGVALIVFHMVGVEFMPRSDESRLIATVEMPPGTAIEVTDRAARQVEDRFRAWPETRSVFSSVGTGGTSGGASQARFARVTVELTKPHERSRTQAELAVAARSLADGIPGARLQVSPGGFMSSGAPPLYVVVSGDEGGPLESLVARVEEIIRRTPGTTDVANSAAPGAPEVPSALPRDRAAELGLTAGQIAQALRTGIAGTVATQYQPAGQKGVDVRVMLDDADRASLDQLGAIPLVGSRGVQVRLDQVATLRPSAGPSQITRRDRQRYVALTAELTDRSLGDVVRDVQAEVDKLGLPPGFKVSFTGEAEAQSESFAQIFEALLLSVLLMYMLMVALYESLLSPFVVMLSLPLALVGAIAGLYATGSTLNMMSMIGMIMLAGLVGKNAILLVDYTNTLRKGGIARDAALLQAGPTRLRPILMTTAAMVLAMAPAAAQIGEGAEMSAPLAVVVIGGLLSSTLLTLVVIPAVYTIVDDAGALLGRPFRRQQAREPAPIVPLRSASPREQPPRASA